VITTTKGIPILHSGSYNEHSPPTEQVDIVTQSLPIPVLFKFCACVTDHIASVEREHLDGLEKAGFKLHYGPTGGGVFQLYYTRGGGYYIDSGCSQLIIDGKIKVKQSPEGIAGFKPHSLVLKDGSELEADVVVLATGYRNMRSSVHKVLGDKIADQCRDVWDLDEEGEVNTMWRPSGHPRFWFMGGNLALCRIYSKFLALQIKAIEEGLTPAPPTTT